MEKMQWEIYVPIFRNRFILKGIGLAVGLPFGIVIAYILVMSKGDIMGTDAKYALLLIGLLFLITYLVILAVYGGRYAPGFILDESGIVNYTQANQVKRNKMINGLLIAFGLFSASPTAVGTGLIANSRQVMKLKWNSIRKVRYYPRQYTILVWGGFTEKIAVFCTPENYPVAASLIKQQLAGPGTGASFSGPVV